jgi:hypothetical protein
MGYMFHGATAFNQPIGSWDLSGVTDINRMFQDDTAFNQPLNSWTVGNVVDFSYIFSGANSFDQNLSNWNFASATGVDGFLEFITISTPNYDELLNAMYNTYGYSGLPFGGGNSQYSVVGEPARTGLIADGWTITDGGCDGSCPVVCTFCTETCSPCGGGCTSTDLTDMYLGYDFVTDSLGVGNISGWNTSCITDITRLFENSNFNQDIGNWDTGSITGMTEVFVSTPFNQNITGWDTHNVIYMGICLIQQLHLIKISDYGILVVLLR